MFWRKPEASWKVIVATGSHALIRYRGVEFEVSTTGNYWFCHRGYRTDQMPFGLVIGTEGGWGKSRRDACVRAVCRSIDETLREEAAEREFAKAKAAAAPVHEEGNA